MANTAKTKIQKFGKGGMHVYIPATIREDSQNPLRVGNDVVISVDGERMTIAPVQPAKTETGVATPSNNLEVAGT